MITLQPETYYYQIAGYAVRFMAIARWEAERTVTQEIGPCVVGNLSKHPGTGKKIITLDAWKALPK